MKIARQTARFSTKVLGSFKMFGGGMMLVMASIVISMQAEKMILSCIGR